MCDEEIIFSSTAVILCFDSLSLHKESWNRNDDIGSFAFIPLLM